MIFLHIDNYLMGGCTSAPISITDKQIRENFGPPEPKISVPENKSQKVIEECLDKDDLQTTTASISSQEETVNEPEIIHQRKPSYGVIRSNSVRVINPPEPDEDIHLSWGKRRNSEKEKYQFVKYKTEQAKIELQKRLSLRTVVRSKCPTCGDLGPETSNQYYTFYLIVPSIITKTKCRRCNVPFSFEYVGHVKSINDTINLILDEEL